LAVHRYMLFPAGVDRRAPPVHTRRPVVDGSVAFVHGLRGVVHVPAAGCARPPRRDVPV